MIILFFFLIIRLITFIVFYTSNIKTRIISEFLIFSYYTLFDNVSKLLYCLKILTKNHNSSKIWKSAHEFRRILIRRKRGKPGDSWSNQEIWQAWTSTTTTTTCSPKCLQWECWINVTGTYPYASSRRDSDNQEPTTAINTTATISQHPQPHVENL